MSDLALGDVVICVDAGPCIQCGGPQRLILRAIYTIKRVSLRAVSVCETDACACPVRRGRADASGFLPKRFCKLYTPDEEVTREVVEPVPTYAPKTERA